MVCKYTELKVCKFKDSSILPNHKVNVDKTSSVYTNNRYFNGIEFEIQMILLPKNVFKPHHEKMCPL